MSFQRVFLAVFLGLSLNAMAGGVPVGASEETATAEVASTDSTPEATIEGFNAAVLEVIGTPEDAEFAVRLEIMKNAVGEAFDMPVLARRTMSGTAWGAWSSEQKLTYVETLQTYQAAVLADRFKPGADVTFEIDGVEDGARGTKLVKTRILRPDDEDVKLNYLTADREGVWRVVDIYLNSTISEVALRRSEYSAIVAEQGFDGLIDALNAQIEAIVVANTPGADEESLANEEAAEDGMVSQEDVAPDAVADEGETATE